MPEPKTILATCATGFLVSHLTTRLLRDGHRVFALSRGSKNASPKARLEAVLRDVGVSEFGNLEIVEGDISLPNLGLNDSARQRVVSEIDELWHCAASLSFEHED